MEIQLEKKLKGFQYKKRSTTTDECQHSLPINEAVSIYTLQFNLLSEMRFISK